MPLFVCSFLTSLRVSQFSEDKVGPADPMQKSITNFVIMGDASGTNIHSSDSSMLKAKDDSFLSEIGDDFTVCDHSSGYVQTDVLDSDRISDLCYSSCSIIENATDMALNSVQAEANAGLHISGLHQPVVVQLLETYFCRNSKNINEVTRCTSFRDDDAAPSSSLHDWFHWVDDYKCSICGIEIPLEFVDERQEHSDFHLAEKLQEECYGSSSLNRCLDRRPIKKDQIVNQSRNKRRKSLPEQGKYLPIDRIFKKKNQNLWHVYMQPM